jgi:hypothetical protein
MPSALITIATFATPEEAELAKSVLAGESIACYLEGAALIGMVWYLGNATGGVKLQVSETDAERARLILASRTTDNRNSGAAARDLTCPQCGTTIENGFETCWSCGAAVDSPEKPVSRDCEPTEPKVIDEEEDASSQPFAVGDAAAQRAWRAAVIGIFVLPPLLNAYSLWILFDPKTLEARRSDLGSRKYRLALWLDLAVIVAVALFVRLIIYR